MVYMMCMNVNGKVTMHVCRYAVCMYISDDDIDSDSDSDDE
jgi:hypothetical protein